jgi:membrane protein DedA with SNARE-associated domain
MFDWALSVMEANGYLGIFALMVLENVFPPIPSEIIIPVAGYAAASGTFHIALVILVASLGATVGATIWYVIGRVFGIVRLRILSGRYGRLLTLAPHDIDAAEGWFARHGRKAVLIGRVIPTIRTLISIPAGIARMPVLEFLFFTFLGSLVWSTALAIAGFVLEQNAAAASHWLNPVSDAVVILIVLTYLYRVVTFKR